MSGDRLIDGNVKVWWVTTLSSTTSPTAAQINAGVSLESFLTKDGLKISVDIGSVDTSSLSNLSETSDYGRSTAAPVLTMKRKTVDTAWTTFSGKPSGFLVVRRGLANTTTGIAGQKVSVFPCKAGVRAEEDPAINEVDKFTVKLALIDDYIEEATVA